MMNIFNNLLERETDFLELRNNPSSAIIKSNDYRSLMSIDEALSTSSQRPAVLLWSEAMKTPALQEAMSDTNWPIDFYDSFANNDAWNWDLTDDYGKKTASSETIRHRLKQATGTEQPATGNVIATLKIRDYQATNREIGRPDWFAKQLPGLRSGLGKLVLETLTEKLQIAERSSRNLFLVEEISLILTKDSTRPPATLTPTLHSDKYYAERETAITSIMEPGFDIFGGAVFVLGKTMSEIWQHRPIDLEKVFSLFPVQNLFSPNSGDIAIYDGMISADGAENRGLGVPHISPDFPGRTARIVILMRHLLNVG